MSKPIRTTTLPELGERPYTETCRSCGAEVVWLQKPTGPSRMIVDATPAALAIRYEDGRFDPATCTPHIETCKDKEKWSRRLRDGGPA